jgi:large subunit ribosomal protein L4
VQATVLNLSGAEVQTIELDDYIFGIEPNMAIMHQALVRQHANARQGTASTKTRGEVRGGGKKPYKQKGTGNARQGSRRAPHYRGGAVIFGPRPRSYEKDMPRKMRRLAMRSALSVKAKEENLLFVESFAGLEPRVKAMVETLKALKLESEKVLILIPERDETVYRAAGNLANVKLLNAGYVNMDDMFKYNKVIVPLGALEVLNRILGQSESAAEEE